RPGPLELTNLVLDRAVGAILLGAAASASQDDKGALRILGPLVAGIVARRPTLPVVLVGAAVQHRSAIESARDRVIAPLVALPDGAATGATAAALRAALDGLRA